MRPVAVIFATLLALGLVTSTQAMISAIMPVIPTLKCDQVTITVSNNRYQQVEIWTPASSGAVWCENEATTCQILNASNLYESFPCNKYWNTRAGWWRLAADGDNCWSACPNTGTTPSSTSWCTPIQLNSATILNVLRRLGLDTMGYIVSLNTGTSPNSQYPALETNNVPFVAYYGSMLSGCPRTGGAQANYQNICCCANTADATEIAARCPTSEYQSIASY